MTSEEKKLPSEFKEKLDDLYHKFLNIEPLFIKNEKGDEVRWWIEEVRMRTDFEWFFAVDKPHGGPLYVDVDVFRWLMMGSIRATARMDFEGNFMLFEQPVIPPECCYRFGDRAPRSE
jgi:hypothetical protein